MRELASVPLAPLTSLRLGGHADTLVEATSEDELVESVVGASASSPVVVLGGGSNVVVADAGVRGRVVRVMTRGVVVKEQNERDMLLEVQAGESWDALVERCTLEGWAGFESMSGIPGMVGATPIQNVGAYGYEVSTFVEGVKVLDRTTSLSSIMTQHACAFGYRDSAFKRESGRYVVLSVLFRLARATESHVRYAELARALGVAEHARASLSDVREAVIALRRKKGMVLDERDLDTRSAGSFFTNAIVTRETFASLVMRARSLGMCSLAEELPHFVHGERVKVPAAWLIEKSGFAKGYSQGNVGISTKHSLALVNLGGTTADLLRLAEDIVNKVNDVWGVVLEREPVLMGDFSSTSVSLLA